MLIRIRGARQLDAKNEPANVKRCCISRELFESSLEITPGIARVVVWLGSHRVCSGNDHPQGFWGHREQLGRMGDQLAVNIHRQAGLGN